MEYDFELEKLMFPICYRSSEPNWRERFRKMLHFLHSLKWGHTPDFYAEITRKETLDRFRRFMSYYSTSFIKWMEPNDENAQKDWNIVGLNYQGAIFFKINTYANERWYVPSERKALCDEGAFESSVIRLREFELIKIMDHLKIT